MSVAENLKKLGLTLPNIPTLKTRRMTVGGMARCNFMTIPSYSEQQLAKPLAAKSGFDLSVMPLAGRSV